MKLNRGHELKANCFNKISLKAFKSNGWPVYKLNM